MADTRADESFRSFDNLLAALPALVEAECQRRGITQAEAAGELGFSRSTITRLIQGHAVDARSVFNLVRWLGLAAQWLREPVDAHEAYRRGWNDFAVRVRALVDETKAAP